MTTLEPKAGERVMDVRVMDDTISVDLFDGRTIMVPLAWFPRLLHATPEQRENWHIAGAGYGIYVAWTKFIKQSSATVNSAGNARSEKVLNPK